MDLVVVSGLSGSGKTTALHALEDLDYYCIDNLPVGLIPAFAEHIVADPEKLVVRAAIGIDARNRMEDIKKFPGILIKLRASGIKCDVIFLNANNDILIKRFSETRRKHPLTSNDTSLAEAIEREQDILLPISNSADLFLDTSMYNVHRLRDVIRKRVGNDTGNELSILFESFGYKHGIPVDADFVFDIRCLPNPHWEPALRELTGNDQAVIDYLDGQEMVQKMFDQIRSFMENWIPEFVRENRTYMTVAIGCTGGMHRSVYMASRLARRFNRLYANVLCQHRELS